MKVCEIKSKNGIVMNVGASVRWLPFLYILNTTETSPDDKKVTCEKNSCLIHTISLAIVGLLLLAVVSICCYYYYKRDLIK